TTDRASHPFDLTFRYYNSKHGSGVYSFNPRGKQSLPIQADLPPIVIVEGKLQSYVEVWLPTVKHKLTLYNTKGFEDYALDIKNTIDITQLFNFELLMRITTNISSNNTFYTDNSNGFQMMRRKTREKIPIQGNYYPLASSAFIEDSQTRLTILTAQPGAGASFKPGELEIIQDRIIHMDDSHGMGEGGSDNLETVSKYRVLLEDIKASNETSDNNKYVPFLSLAAHHHINTLLHPVRGFVLREKKKTVAVGAPIAVNFSSEVTEIVEESEVHTVNKIVEESEVHTVNSNGDGIKSKRGSSLQGEIRPSSLMQHQIADYIPGSNNLNPCDIFLATVQPLPEYRSSQEVNDTKLFLTAGNVGLVFHRGLFEDKYRRTSLTFVHEDGDISSDVVQLEQMSVQGIIAEYKNLEESPWKSPILFDLKG
ncbi:unnamed protein product, partial [Allacma fusca]